VKESLVFALLAGSMTSAALPDSDFFASVGELDVPGSIL
jgi:hypothetical protein